MVIAYQTGAVVLGILGALEAVRAVSLWWSRDDEARPSGYAAATLLSIGLLFGVMAQIDG